jgi:hypothetical protein
MKLCQTIRPFRKMLAAAGVMLLLTAPMTGHAALVAGTGTDTTGGFGVGFSFSSDVNLVIGQQFFPTIPVIANSITLYLNDDNAANGADAFTLYVTNAIGASATAANVLATLSGTFPLTSGGHAPVTFSSLALPLLPAPLAPDGYFLVLASSGGPDTGWGTGATPISSPLGTIGNSYVGIVLGGGVGDYTTLDPLDPNSSITAFRVDTLAAPIPEPSTYALMLAGLGFVGFVAHRRRRKQP